MNIDADQRLQGRRTDVLVYEGDVLKSDLTVAGPVEVSLQVSTTGTDADWVVKLIDVYPADMPDKLGGYQQLVRGDVMLDQGCSPWGELDSMAIISFDIQ